ncbi:MULTISPECIES: CIS tube protein [Mesonia]|uniref:Uncharacterized protein n=1 Tax=Mesonia oceanica TaxID=2687242 RepID=A0AC61Y3Z0_9FLAO|nr:MULTISPECIES: hypothetical protein [Mesonia]MAN28794.1 hypothetical protein [Mesonia sp.]MAQ41874.1 hypothetical protein [Mesonia sp.]MBJ99003.1 hypothetical protein [Flavobacteriaceae bacterium]VVU99201.1 hypothetical protein FVB9532_00453 [Mesonia oceanica]|tara:strand:- start:38906 stop:39568 length:663 start_codon:yes stop_codon:yes gene_type:complete
MNQGLVNLTIYAYTDVAFSSSAGSYKTLINPESYSHQHGVSFSETKSVAEGAGNAPKFNTVQSEKVSFTMYIDGTGIKNNIGSIAKEITSLKKVVYQYEGSIHRTKYLKLSFGALVFYCNLESMQIHYTMFSSSGEPLRAKIDFSFVGYTNPALLSANANKQSPDMNHIKTITATSSLPNLCEEVYKNANLYEQVAKLNDLDSFRGLTPGLELAFPQLKQ